MGGLEKLTIISVLLRFFMVNICKDVAPLSSRALIIVTLAGRLFNALATAAKTGGKCASPGTDNRNINYLLQLGSPIQAVAKLNLLTNRIVMRMTEAVRGGFSL